MGSLVMCCITESVMLLHVTCSKCSHACIVSVCRKGSISLGRQESSFSIKVLSYSSIPSIKERERYLEVMCTFMKCSSDVNMHSNFQLEILAPKPFLGNKGAVNKLLLIFDFISEILA